MYFMLLSLRTKLLSSLEVHDRVIGSRWEDLHDASRSNGQRASKCDLALSVAAARDRDAKHAPPRPAAVASLPTRSSYVHDNITGRRLATD